MKRLTVGINAQGKIMQVSQDLFLERLLAHLPSTPPNYAQIIRFNEAGIQLWQDLTELEAGANRCALS